MSYIPMFVCLSFLFALPFLSNDSLSTWTRSLSWLVYYRSGMKLILVLFLIYGLADILLENSAVTYKPIIKDKNWGFHG